MIFDGVSLATRENHARVGNLVISNYNAQIPDLRKGVLQITGRQRLGVDQVLDFIRATPVSESLGPTFSRVSGSGPVTTSLDLSLPLTQPKDYELRVLFDMEAGNIAFAGVPVTLERLRGRVTLHNKQLSSEGLTGLLLQEPVIVTLQAAADPDAAYSHTAELRGENPVVKIMEAFHLPFPDQFSGRARWQASLRFPSRHVQPAAPLRLDIRSDLRGVVSSLPKPLTKPADTDWPVELNLNFPKDGVVQLAGHLQPPIAWALRLESGPAGWRVERGAVNAGGAAAALPDQPGVELSGGLAELRLADWLKLGSAGGGDGKAFRELYRGASFGVGKLAVAGQVFRDAFVMARRGTDGWAVDIESPNVAGRVNVPFDTRAGQPIVLDLDRLWMLESEAADGSRADPRNVPALDIRATDAAIGKWHLGGLQGIVSKTDDGILVKPIVVHGPSFSFDGEGSWRVDPARPEQQISSLQLAVRSTDLADTLEQLGFDRIISGKGGKLTANLIWPGPPSAQFMDAASGQMGFEFNKGQFLDVEPGGGRLLGLLSLSALPRRLSLDFRDVFNKGLAFDSVKGDFRLVTGSAYTCNLGLEGPSAAIGVIGRTGLAAKDYDQLAVVRPQVSNMLNIGTIGGVVLGGPVGGVTMLLISQIFRKPLSALGESYYRVSGKWDKPVIDRIQHSQVDTAAFKDCEQELATTLQALPVPAEGSAPAPQRP